MLASRLRARWVSTLTAVRLGAGPPLSRSSRGRGRTGRRCLSAEGSGEALARGRAEPRGFVPARLRALAVAPREDVVERGRARGVGRGREQAAELRLPLREDGDEGRGEGRRGARAADNGPRSVGADLPAAVRVGVGGA